MDCDFPSHHGADAPTPWLLIAGIFAVAAVAGVLRRVVHLHVSWHVHLQWPDIALTVFFVVAPVLIWGVLRLEARERAAEGEQVPQVTRWRGGERMRP